MSRSTRSAYRVWDARSYARPAGWSIESGVDPVLVGERFQALKGERQQSETALAQLDLLQRERIGLDLAEAYAYAVLDSLPDLSKPLAKADPELRRSVYEAFQFGIELDPNRPEIRLKALVSSAFSTTKDLHDLAGKVANGVIAGAGLIRDPATEIRAWAVWDLAGRRWISEQIW